MNKTILSLLLIVFFIDVVQAQYTIDGSGGASPLSTCTGTFLDDGDGGPYTDNNYTYTICPDNPGDVIQLDFVSFQLATDPNPNNSDYLYVFDGEDTSAPGFGSYTGSQLTGVPFVGSINNTSGCLTVFFDSNTGNPTQANGFQANGWEALISCTTPCASPTGVSSFVSPTPINNGQTVTLCMGAPVSFTGAGSFAEPGFSLDQYVWNFDDGSVDSTSGINAIHSWSEPGEYLVSLSVYDNNGCQSLNLEPLQVLVSTLPQIDLEYDETVCLGDSAVLFGTAEGTTWTALPPQVVAGETYLTDGPGFSFSSCLEFDFFEPDQVLETCDDLLSITVNMEHSFLGDLEMYIECPDGTQVTLLSFSNNSGGGTYLGEAVDNVNGNTSTPGVGYDYGWAPGLTNGNLDDGNSSSVSFTDNEGFSVTNDVVIPGLYQSEEDLCGLVGCPLNGTWCFNVIDNLAIDNGYIFEWGINLNPALFPDVTTFTPTIGQDIDSTWWTGPAGANIFDEGNTVTFYPEVVGTYDFTFNTMNSFGCGYDTTITVTVEEMPQIEAWPDIVIDCEDPTQVGVDIIGGSASDFDFSWSPAEYFSVPTLQNPTATGVNSTVTFQVVVNVEDHPACFRTDYMTVSVPGELILDPDTAVCTMQYQLNAGSVGLGEWTVPAGLTLSGTGNPINDPNALVTADTPGVYTLTWTDTEGLSCPNSRDVVISFFDGIDITPTITDALCFGECSGEVIVTGVGGMVASDYSYVFANMDPTNVILNHVTSVCPGAYSVTLIDDNGCSESTDFAIAEPPMPIIDEVLAEREECFGYCNGTIEVVSDEAVSYSYDGGVLYDTSAVRNDFCSGSYEIYIKDDNGCIGGPTSVFVDSPEPPEANFDAEPPVVDVLDPTISFINTSDGAVSYEWIFNTSDPFGTSDEENPVFHFPAEPGVYPIQLTIIDDIGCPDDIIREITVNDVFQVFIPSSFTPNEDGLNDLFSPVGGDIDPTYYTFVVYDRWGGVLYESHTYPHAWNGSLNNGKQYYAADGYYDWHLITRSKTTTDKMDITGSVLIIR